MEDAGSLANREAVKWIFAKQGTRRVCCQWQGLGPQRYIRAQHTSVFPYHRVESSSLSQHGFGRYLWISFAMKNSETMHQLNSCIHARDLSLLGFNKEEELVTLTRRSSFIMKRWNLPTQSPQAICLIDLSCN